MITFQVKRKMGERWKQVINWAIKSRQNCQVGKRGRKNAYQGVDGIVNGKVRD